MYDYSKTFPKIFRSALVKKCVFLWNYRSSVAQSTILHTHVIFVNRLTPVKTLMRSTINRNTRSLIWRNALGAANNYPKGQATTITFSGNARRSRKTRSNAKPNLGQWKVELGKGNPRCIRTDQLASPRPLKIQFMYDYSESFLKLCMNWNIIYFDEFTEVPLQCLRSEI
jgi:hypothetical protein